MKKKVAHFIRKSTQLRASFIQNQIYNHINYEPVVIYKYDSNKNDGGYADFYNNSIKILNLWNNKDNKSKILYRYPKLITSEDIKEIELFVKENNVDILHFHYGTDAGIYSPFLRKTSIPSVVSFYGYDCSGFPKRFLGYGKYYLNKRVFPFVNKIIAMSPDMKKDLMNIGCPENKLITHYYGTDIKKFITKHQYRSREEVVFLLISGLVPKKGHMFLLKAFIEAHNSNNNIRLKIYGRGMLEKSIRTYIRNNKLEFIQFNGSIVYGSKDHFHELNEADVFIHPSVTDRKGYKEGIPGAIVEAMAAGLPVISTYHAGIPYIIKNHETGLLIREWDYEDLVKSILELTENLQLRKTLGQNGQDYALKYLNLSIKESELEKIYDNLIV